MVDVLEKLETDSKAEGLAKRGGKRRSAAHALPAMGRPPGPGKGNRAGRAAGNRVTARDREAIGRIFQETGNMAETARRTGWDYGTVWKHLKSMDRDNLRKTANVNIGPPVPWSELGERERGWLTNFAEFRRHFFNRDTPPFQQYIADLISARTHPKLLVLTPPGHGKSQCFSVDYPIWEMIRNRAKGTRDGWACLLISKSDKMAKAFLSQIKKELEQNVDLQLAFGRFKPEYPDVWSQDKVTVEGFPIRKEPTYIAAGAGSHIYGWRVHLIIGDDIVDGENSATPEKADKLAEWHADELVSRLEPDGVIADIGTRFAVFDLHGKLARQTDDDDERLWFPVIFRAHDDAKCQGVHCEVCKERCEHDQPQPDGCVLWPGRFGYRKLRSLRSGQTTSSRFEFLYNQYEVPDEGALVRPEWSEKCKNVNRVLWDLPTSMCRTMCTLDPSPTKWAVAQAWAYVPEEERRYFLCQWRKRRTLAPEYLTLMKDWTLRLRARGQEPIWVVEVNAAQRWLLQSTEYQVMRAELGLTVIPHTTGRNKADAEYGVQCISPSYEFQRVDLPWGDSESRKVVGDLLDELHSYPTGETDDAVMAEWFMEFNLKRLIMPTNAQFMEQPYMPPYLMERRAIVDLHTGLRTTVKSDMLT